MNELEKFLRKANQKQRNLVREIINRLEVEGLDATGLNIIKLKDSSFFRIKKERIRIIFRINDRGEPEVDAIRFRNEKTYKKY